jgi:hypothetical protein
VSGLKSRVLKFFQDIKGWRLWLLISALVMVGVEIIVMVMDMWLKGLVLQDDLLIGLVAVGFVSPTFLFLTEYLRGEFVKQREHRLQLETVKELNDMQGSYQWCGACRTCVSPMSTKRSANYPVTAKRKC